MKLRRRNVLIGLAVFVGVAVVALFTIAHFVAKRFEPYIRAQAVQYLEQRFNSDVELDSLRIQMPQLSPLKLWLEHGRGAMARVDGAGVSLRLRGRQDLPPIFKMKSFDFEVDLATIFDPVKKVQRVEIQDMELNIPPKEQRPDINAGTDDRENTASKSSTAPAVIFQEVRIHNSSLTIIPDEKDKKPLRWDLHEVKLEDAGLGVAMNYDAGITNAKPPGEIHSKGTFGPWATDDPGDTPVAGEYTFEKADLGVFSGIAGILNSTGRFQGTLDSLNVEGQATVPDFRLKSSGNRVKLVTSFEVLVDGTNGDTVLRPVRGTLGSTNFTTSGGVLKNEITDHRSIDLDVNMPAGNLRDLLTLAMKGPAFMEGQIALQTKVGIPPLTGKVKDKLNLDGQFHITHARFLKSTIQSQIDALSRRGQGQPKNDEIDEVVSQMAGAFKLRNAVISFSALSFAVPGAGVDLHGDYDMDKDIIDFHGSLSLQAKVSETMTGWKRWVLKPLNPFFSNHGAGTFLRIQVTGSSDKPQFGRDRQ